MSLPSMDCPGIGQAGTRTNGKRGGRCPVCNEVAHVTLDGKIGAHRKRPRKTDRFTRADPIEVRLWSQVNKTPSGCWEFTGRLHPNGYGTICYRNRLWQAHRVAYTLTKGEIPAGLFVMHACDNPPCINPDHLSVGTVADNNRDREEKGRGVYPGHGAGSWQKRLTHCKHGHEFTTENTSWSKPRPDRNPARVCKTCKRETYYRLKRAS